MAFDLNNWENGITVNKNRKYEGDNKFERLL